MRATRKLKLKLKKEKKDGCFEKPKMAQA